MDDTVIETGLVEKDSAEIMSSEEFTKLMEQARAEEEEQVEVLADDAGARKLRITDANMGEHWDLVILSNRKVNSYWEGKYEGQNDPPDCFSNNGVSGTSRQVDGEFVLWTDNGGRNECRKCPHNQFGSAENKKGKACRNGYQVWVVRDGERVPEVLMIPPTSIRNWTNFLLKLRDDNVSPRFMGLVRVKKVEGGQQGKFTFDLIRKFGPDDPSVQALAQLHLEYKDRLLSLESLSQEDFDIEDADTTNF